MKLFITRHGETDWNVQEKVCGISEAQLTENGRQQAQLLAQQLERDKDKNNIGAIYVSPLKRARETASYIEQVLHIQAVVEKRIQEVNFGSFEGKNWKSDEFLKIRNSPFMKFPGGESLTSAAARSYSFIEEIAKKYTRADRAALSDTAVHESAANSTVSALGKPEANVLFVCHGLISAIMSTYFKSMSIEDFMNLKIKNCQLLEFDL